MKIFNSAQNWLLRENIFLGIQQVLRKPAFLGCALTNIFCQAAFPTSFEPTDDCPPFMDYRAAKQFILAKLRAELSDQLTYHGLHHTLDVLKMATEICESEGVGERDRILVKTAALFHDAGFVKNKHAGHEAEGCILVRESLPQFGYKLVDIECICGMIMATKIPQSPGNLLEQILCDADLDYLGREDFFAIGETLFEELQAYNLIGDAQSWNRLQVSFLSAHRFHTRTNKTMREPVKRRYLEDLQDLVATYA